MKWQVVMFYGDGCNDYKERRFRVKEDAENFLSSKGYHYSTTHGSEDVFHNDDDHIASISPEGENE